MIIDKRPRTPYTVAKPKRGRFSVPLVPRSRASAQRTMAKTSIEVTSKGWMPEATKVSIPASNFSVGCATRKAVVLHIGEGSANAILGEFKPEGKQKSAHFVVTNAGHIYQCVSVLDTAFANGLSWSVSRGCWVDPEKNLLKAHSPAWQGLSPPTNPNWQTVSIEREGYYQEQPSDVENAAVVRILQYVHSQFPTLLPAWAFMQTLIGHCHISPKARANCPGPHVNYTALAAAANAPLTPPVSLPTTLITPLSQLIWEPRAEPQQCVAYILRKPHGEYDEYDIRSIVQSYYQNATGIDPLLAIAQAIHETGNLSSYWAARPRRNPAGIGVIGVAGAGVHFGSWSEASRAHVGRLLAYALPEGGGTPAQQRMIQSALAVRPLPLAYRGAAPALRGLEGRWANPGVGYADKLAAIANQIRSVG